MDIRIKENIAQIFEYTHSDSNCRLKTE